MMSYYEVCRIAETFKVNSCLNQQDENAAAIWSTQLNHVYEVLVVFVLLIWNSFPIYQI